MFYFLIFIPLIASDKIQQVGRIIQGQEFSLQCPFKETLNKDIFQWFFKPYNEESERLICNKPPDKALCLRSKDEIIENIIDITAHHIIIGNANSKNSGFYKCVHVSYPEFERHYFNVSVLTPPGKPQIYSNSSLTENVSAYLKCTSEGGHPSPILKWVWKDFSNNLISKERRIKTTLTSSTTKYGITTLSTTWLPRSNEDGDSLNCVAENSLATVSSNWVYISINYAPIIYEFPQKTYYGLQGDEINIECKATSKSSATYKWISDKGTVYSDGSYLIIKPLRTSDKGSYSCVVKNSYGTSSTSLDIKVLYEPKINVPASVVINEWETLNLTCDAIPTTSNITWWLKDKVLFNRKNLVYNVVGHNSFEIECRAYVFVKRHLQYSIITSSKRKVKVIVHYIPQKPTISAIPAGKLMTGSSVTLTCIANKKRPGLPNPDYSWKKRHTDWNTNGTNFLSISPLQFEHSGIYCCKLFNALGSSDESCYALNIEGKPMIRKPTLSSSMDVLARIGHSFDIVCPFQAQPHPAINWFNNDGLLENNGKSTRFNVENKSTNNSLITSILHVNEPIVDGNEKYRCTAENKYGTIFKDFVVKVIYSPRILSNVFIKAANISGFSSDKQSVSLNCTVTASPVIRILWIRKLHNFNEKIIENDTDKYLIKERNLLGIMGVESLLFIKDFQTDDYGAYICYANNSEGHIANDFIIRKFAIPDPAHNLVIESRTCCSLTLKWNAGFDGGYQQIFTVSYTTNMQKHPFQVRTTHSNITLINLLPEVLYIVNISSSNQIGTSTLVRSIETRTAELTIDRDQIFFVNKDEKFIEFSLPSNMSSSLFCLTIENMDTQKDLVGDWALVGKCLKNTIRKIRIENPNDRFRVKMCLINLPDVCSAYFNQRIENNPSDAYVSTRLIGTVAAICTALVIVLAILLFFILIRSKNFLPVITDLKVMKRTRKSSYSKEDSLHFDAKSLTPLCSKKQPFIKESGGCPVLSTYSCDQVHSPGNPIEILNVCPPHNILIEGLYSTLVKPSIISPFPYNLSPQESVQQSHLNNVSSCCCHDDQQVYSMSLPASKSLKPDKIIYEVMV